MKQDKLVIFDTTLRDGEQSPGIALTPQEKLIIAQQLEKLKVDVIEAGFAASSPGDWQGVNLIANSVKGSTIASLARCVVDDIDQAWEAIKPAANVNKERINDNVCSAVDHKVSLKSVSRPRALKEIDLFFK